MSIFPCERCKRPVKGALSAAYINLANGNARAGRKLRLCDGHLRDLVDEMRSWWVEVLDDYTQTSMYDCFHCQAEIGREDARYGLFGNVYPKGQEPTFFYGVLCEEDASALKLKFSLLEQ